VTPDPVLLGAAAGLLVLLAAAGASWVLSARPALAARLPGLAGPAAWALILALVVGLVLGAIPRGLSARRQLLVFWPVLVLLGAWACVRLHRRALAIGSVALGLALSIAMVLGPPYEDWRGVTAFLAGHAQPDDQILIDASYAADAFDYYYHGPAPYAGFGPDELNASPGQRLAPSQHAWLVLVNTEQADPTGQVAAWVEGQARLVARYSFGRITVDDYLPR
jgi:hypothetical protein